MSKETIITIGRDPSNSVVLNEANVSSFHARLTQSADKIILEDLGSTNGTSVGKVENKIQHAVVDLSDTIFFGSSPFLVSDFVSTPNGSSKRTPKPASTDSANTQPSQQSSPKAIGLALAGIGLVVLIGLGLLGSSVFNAYHSEIAIVAPLESISEPNTPLSKPGDISQTAAIESKDDTAADTAIELPESLSPIQTLQRSMFVVVCSDSDRESYRVGTAFSIDAKHVVTTASVVRALQELKQNGFGTATLFSPVLEETFDIASTRIHPQFSQASIEAQRAQQEHDAIYDELESKPPNPEAFDAVKDRLLATRVAAIGAMDRKTTYDVGLIELKQDLKHSLTGASVNASLRPNMKIEVIGYGFDSNDPFFDKSEATQLRTMKGRVHQVALSSDHIARRLLATGTNLHSEFAFEGSPAINAQGQVVAIYSRPTPDSGGTDLQRDGDDSQPVSMFDAPLFERVRECLDAPQ